jgi:hypothetical protein
MKNVWEVYNQKNAEYEDLLKVVTAFKIVIPHLLEDHERKPTTDPKNPPPAAPNQPATDAQKPPTAEEKKKIWPAP